MRTIRTKKRLTQALLAIALIVAAISGAVALNHFFLAQPISDPVSMTTGLPVDNSEDKSDNEKSEYTVPATQPRNIQIDSIGVNANIVPIGLLEDNTLDAPKTAWNVGWYKGSNKPSEGTGALLADGHVNNTLGTPGVFYDLHKLKAGDEINVETGNGKNYKYIVKKVEQLPTADVNMSSMMKSIEPDKQGFNIITCGGDYNHKKSTFDDRILVYAVQAEPSVD